MIYNILFAQKTVQKKISNVFLKSCYKLLYNICNDSSMIQVTNETAPLQKFALMKSNSLSNDRWKIANEGGGENGGGIMAASSNSSNLDRGIHINMYI